MAEEVLPEPALRSRFGCVDGFFPNGYVVLMAAAILDAEELAGLVQPDKIAEAGFVRPKRVLVVPSTDQTGHDAFYVYLVFPNETPDEDLAWDKVKAMLHWAWDRIWKANGEERWPYVDVTREADLPNYLR